MSDVELDDYGAVDPLTGFHTFTGNDFTSFFFRKGKNACFKSLNSSSQFKVALAGLGSLWDLSDDIFDVLQNFIVSLYRVKNVNGNEKRHKIFSRKFRDENKTVNMNVLPPWEPAVRLHSERVNYIAATLKRVTINQLNFPNMALHGWNSDKSITWVIDIFPEKIEKMLLENRYSPNDVKGAHRESDVKKRQIYSASSIYEIKYSRMEQVKFVEDSLEGDHTPSNFFKGCLPQILLGPFLNTLSHI